MISDNVKILASDSHSIRSNKTYECINYHKTGISIGNHVWIGMNAIILKDSQVGDNSVIATGAIVTSKEKRENVILGGNPARVIKSNIFWERKQPQNTHLTQEIQFNQEIKEGEIAVFLDETLNTKNEIRKISGWAYLENADSLKSKIYFEFKDRFRNKIYEAQTSERKDISNIYGERYINSGFEIILPNKIKIKKLQEINIIIENKEKIYKKNIWQKNKKG